MKNSKLHLIPVVGLTLALGLFGCAGGSNNEATEDTAEETTTETADVAEDAEEGIWALTAARYELSDSVYTLDEQGNLLESVDTIYGDDGGESITYTEAFSYDEDGNIASVSSQYMDEDPIVTEYEVETNEDGLIVSEKNADGYERVYEYDEHGCLAKITHKRSSEDYVYEYDEDGYLISVTSDTYSTKFEYTKNEDGVPTSAYQTTDADGDYSETEITYELDDNGNIVKADSQEIKFVGADGTEEDVSEVGNTISFEYTYIEKPSAGAKLHCMSALADKLAYE